MGAGNRRGSRRMAGLWAAAVVVVGLSAAQPASAATLRVPQDFSTIQAAEDAANPGDLIKISKGTYDESVEVNVSNLRFLGVDGRVIVDADGTNDEVFDIQADNVTLQNLTLRNGESDGVECDGEACTMRGIGVDGDTVGRCLDLKNGDAHVVERSRMVGCSLGAVDVGGDNVQLRGNSARLITGSSCYVVDGASPVLTRNLVQNCTANGFFFFNAHNARLDANILRQTGLTAIFFSGSVQNPVLTRNLIQNVGGDGIEVNCATSCGSGLVQRNVVTGTLSGSGDGFDISVADNAGTFRVLNNTASRVGGEGFDLVGLFNALVRGNLVNRVSDNGFDLDDSDRNQLINNTAILGAGRGFRLDSSDNNTLQGNLAYRNQLDGFQLTDDSVDDNLLDRNRAIRNSQDGIENGGTNTDLTDNRSSGNGGVDCRDTGSVDLNTGNKCADGTSF